MTRATEAECQATIVEAAKLAGWRVHAERPAQGQRGEWRTHLQGHKGFPDLVLCRGSRLMFVELKRKPNRVEPAQQQWIAALSAVGGVWAGVVWVPEEMDAFIAVLARRAA